MKKRTVEEKRQMVDNACKLFSEAIEKTREAKRLLHLCGIKCCDGLSEEEIQCFNPYVSNVQLYSGIKKMSNIIGTKQDYHIYKCIRSFMSNCYCDVPLTYQTENNCHTHDNIVEVVNVIHCGIDENKVIRVARNDIELLPAPDVEPVQEWIPVDERLPENFISVLGYMTDAGEFPPVRECYTVGNAFFFPALGDVHPVSHWCEMPEPPKRRMIMTTLEEKVRNILDGSDFNDLPFDERKRIGKYMDEQQILTIWQTLLKDKHLTTDAWRKKQRQWLENCVEQYRKNYCEWLQQPVEAE